MRNQAELSPSDRRPPGGRRRSAGGASAASRDPALLERTKCGTANAPSDRGGHHPCRWRARSSPVPPTAPAAGRSTACSSRGPTASSPRSSCTASPTRGPRDDDGRHDRPAPSVRERVPARVGPRLAEAPRTCARWRCCCGDRPRSRRESTTTIAAGGKTDSRVGWFVRPTLIRTTDPRHALMQEEPFGPVLTLYVYDDHAEEHALELCAETSPCALTGAVFGADRRRLRLAEDRLRWSAGNFYLNDKPTGAVVGRQPFGGGRASGTNDKGGSMLNLLRWTGARTIKENLSPPTEWSYPHQGSE
ncbi:MAG: aldehyde dehydrogenase family protein [Deltaproteobacteria bacterium]|nr:aldehyde dehydrogenase family protein [Deltaproteobacteria bacterium]